MVLPAAAFRMDEAELLGEADGEATRQISQEEEDALLNGEFEPTTATAAAAADSPAAIFDPPAGVADPTAVADEDDLMNDVRFFVNLFTYFPLLSIFYPSYCRTAKAANHPRRGGR